MNSGRMTRLIRRPSNRPALVRSDHMALPHVSVTYAQKLFSSESGMPAKNSALYVTYRNMCNSPLMFRSRTVKRGQTCFNTFIRLLAV